MCMRAWTRAGCWLCMATMLALAANAGEPAPEPANAAKPAQAAESPANRLASIQVPEGWTVELAADPGLVSFPMMAGFDELGRLYVADSAGVNLPRAELEKQKPSCIRRLEDTDGDGRFDKSTLFADQLTFPQGALWHAGALYVASSPSIWRFVDRDDDGVADERTELVTGFGYTGNAADIHGPFLGPDGRLYWCDGRHGHEIRAADGRLISQGKAARIFSCQKDGSDVQTFCGGGMDNPVELDFTETGEMLGTVNLFYKARGDCLVHWQLGGVYPREDQPECIAEFRRTVGLLGPVFDHGHVAVSGMLRYRTPWPGEVRGPQCFVCEFNTHRVVRINLEPKGATYTATRHEFLTSTDPDFRPTDVLEDADGSLLVMDTGGWFRIGCPNSQVAKPEIRGQIYRVKRKDAAKVEDPRGLLLAWNLLNSDPLIERLADPRWAVRERAAQTLYQNGWGVLRLAHYLRHAEFHRRQVPREIRLAAAWMCVRTRDVTVEHVLSIVLEDPDPAVRQVAIRALGMASFPRIMARFDNYYYAALDDGEDALRREAAVALGRKQRGTLALRRMAGLEQDPLLRHAAVHSLFQSVTQRDLDQWVKQTDDPALQVAAIAITGAIPEDVGSAELTALLLQSNSPDLVELARQQLQLNPPHLLAIVTRIGATLANLTPAECAMLERLIEWHGDRPEVRSLVDRFVPSSESDEGLRDAVLAGWQRLEPKRLDEAYGSHIRRMLASADPIEIERGFTLAARSERGAYQSELYEVAADPRHSKPLRVRAAMLHAITALPADDFIFELIRSDLLGGDATSRYAAAKALARANLTAMQRQQLTESFEMLGTLELLTLLAAYNHTHDAQVAKALFSQLERSPAGQALPRETVESLVATMEERVRPLAGTLLSKLKPASRLDRAELEGRLTRLPAGDQARGGELFRSARGTCQSCHRVGPAGGLIGPDLTLVGLRREPRDLLEAIIAPSASLARGFETYSIETKAGTTIVGLVVGETPKELRVRTPSQVEVRIERAEVESLALNTLSIMPGGYGELFSDQELADLIAYLRGLK